MSYSIRLATPDDRPHLLAIIGELLPGSNAEHRYDWLYRGGTDGPALTWLAIDDQTGEPAGATSFFRRRVLVAGEVVPGALGGDGFVRPAFRRRGIGAALHTASRRDMERHGIQVMFGTPMPANQSPLAHAGAFDVTVSTRFVRPLSAKLLHMPDPVARLMDPLLRPEKQDLRLEPVRPNDPRIDALWRATWLELGVATVRDAAFYTWRFLQAPAQRQQAFVILRGDEPLAACAVMAAGPRMDIVDLLAQRQHWPAALNALAAHAAELGHERIELKLTRESARRYRILLHGFVGRESKPLNVLLPETCRRREFLSDPETWFFTWADSDMDEPD